MGDPRGRPFFVPSDASSLSSSVAFRLNTSPRIHITFTDANLATYFEKVFKKG